MSVPLKIAVVGAGLIGPRHAQSVISNPLTELVAIVDPAPTGAAIAESIGTRHFQSISALLEFAKPDAAIVCTPNHTHVSISKELLSGGVHVLVGHHRRFNPYVLKTKELVSSGSLGRVIGMNGLWTTFKSPTYFAPPTDWSQSRSTGGVITINLVHDIDILHYLFGPIERVYAEQTPSQRANPSHDAEEGTAITLKFASGIVGTFLLCDATPSPHNFEAGTGENPTIPQTGEDTGSDFYRIFGSEASLSVPDMRRWSYGGREEKSWTQKLAMERFEVKDATPFNMQLAHFVDVIQGKAEPSCNDVEGLRALLVCDAIRRTLESNQPVDLRADLDNLAHLY